VQNTTADAFDSPTLALDTGAWILPGYWLQQKVVFSNVVGGECIARNEVLQCSLPPLAAGEVHTVTLNIKAAENLTVLYRGKLASGGIVWPADIALVNLKGWSQTAVSVSPATQPWDDDMLLTFAVTNQGATAQNLVLDIHMPPEATFRSWKLTYIKSVGIDQFHWTEQPWPLKRATIARLYPNGEVRFQIAISKLDTLPDGAYPVVVSVSQSTATPDLLTTDNTAMALLCAGTCNARPTLDIKTVLPAVRR
jgi:hypothetical protein